MVILWLYIKYPSPPPPDVDVCNYFWKYGPSSISYNISPFTYICPDTSIPGYCYLPFNQGVEYCLSDNKCIGFLVEENSNIQLISSEPSNFGKNTNVIYYKKKQ